MALVFDHPGFESGASAFESGREVAAIGEGQTAFIKKLADFGRNSPKKLQPNQAHGLVEFGVFFQRGHQLVLGQPGPGIAVDDDRASGSLVWIDVEAVADNICLLYTSPSPRDLTQDLLCRLLL